MYLGRRKVKGRSYNSEYTKIDLVSLTEEAKVNLVIKLKTGDKDVRDQLILGHIGLLMSIVSRYASRCISRATDIEGVGSLALVEAVDMFAIKGVDNNITPYLVTKMHSAIANYLDEDRPVKTTRYGIAKAIKKAKREGGEVLLPSIFSIDAKSSNEDEKESAMFDKALSSLDSDLTNLDREEDKIKFKQIIHDMSLTVDQFKVLQGLLDGKTEADLSREMRCSRNKINYMKHFVMQQIAHYRGDSTDALI